MTRPRLVEPALLDERLDEDRRAAQPVHARRREVLGLDRGPRVGLGDPWVAAPQR